MGTPLLDDAGRVNWQALERRIPLDELPSFHRAFLNLNRPGEDYSDAFLRQVQGKVQATLKQLERAGRAVVQDDATWVARSAIPEGFQHHLE